MKRLIAIAALALLGACSFSTYAPRFGGVGYSDSRMTADTFQVRFDGHDQETTLRTGEQALLRSAEVTLANGFSHFVVLTEKSDMDVSSYEVPASSTTETTTRAEGKETKTVSTTTYVPAKTVERRFPQTVMTIRVFNGEPAKYNGGTLFDARQLWLDLGAKYKVKREPKR